MSVIQIKYSTAAGHVPTGLVNGQLAINLADGILYWINNSGVQQAFHFGSPLVATMGASDNSTHAANTAFVQGLIDAVVGAAPATLDTLETLAKAINDDPRYSQTVNNILVNCLRFDVPQTLNGSQLALGQANLGLTNLVSMLSFNAQVLSAAQKLQARTNIAAVLRGHIAGLEMTTTSGSSSITIKAGECADSIASDLLVLGSDIIKTTAAWTVGSNQGGLDVGTITPNTWYHFYNIKRLDTGLCDIIFSKNVVAPALPANYTLNRQIFSWKTDASSHWVFGQQRGDDFLYDIPAVDVNGSGLNTTSTLFTLTVPPGLSVLAKLYYEIATTSGSMGLYIQSPLTMTLTSSQSGCWLAVTTPSGAATAGHCEIMTNTAQQIRALANNSGGTQQTSFTTHGFRNTRGRFS